MDDIKDLNSLLYNIAIQPLDIYNDHTYDYSAGYRKCARDILALINDDKEEPTK